MEKAGAAALHIDKGCYEHWYDQISTVYSGIAHQIDVAAAVKHAVNIPVISHGKLNSPDIAEQVLQDGKCDFVAMGHQMLSDPDYANKVKEGRTYDIRPCIGCNECVYVSHQGYDYSCSVNPRTLREDDYPIVEAKEKKKVLVIGGGPGGLAAAITARLRGHDVELWEKNKELGGTLLAAGGPAFKADVKHYAEYLIGKAYRTNVDIRLNKPANADEILKGGFDKVIIAIGGQPVIPPIDGIQSDNVLHAKPVLKELQTFKGQNVVVIGGGLVGVETAVYVAETADKVTIMEMLPDILYKAKHNENNDQHLRKLVADAKVEICTDVSVTKITNESVEYKDGNEVKRVPCDAVILAAGYKVDRTLEEALEGKIDISVVGEAEKCPGKVWNAVHEGFHAARLV